MGHHDIDVGVIRNGVLSDRFGIWGALVGRVETIFMSIIRECPAAELWLVGRCVDLEDVSYGMRV
jgi:hypothetical protein